MLLRLAGTPGGWAVSSAGGGGAPRRRPATVGHTTPHRAMADGVLANDRGMGHPRAGPRRSVFDLDSHRTTNLSLKTKVGR